MSFYFILFVFNLRFVTIYRQAGDGILWLVTTEIQSIFSGSNTFGTIKISSRQG